MGAMRRARIAVSALLAALALSGCATAAPTIAPSGVDELTIPTPSPRPSDFVSAIDNRWLPLAAGNKWNYDITLGTARGERTVTVLEDSVTIAGLGATVVVTEVTGDVEVAPTRDYYAQDRAGNVWWLGREGVWRAGVDGAEAGLAMPAVPRIGDGWRAGFAPGVVEDRLSVSVVDDHLLTLHAASNLTPGVLVSQEYVRDIGLVRTEALGGPLASSQITAGP